MSLDNGPSRSKDTHPKMADSLGMSVPEYYKGKRVLITGATGFIGKVLIEKLLRSCPEVDCLYLLIRPKKGSDVHTRLKEITESKLYDKLRQLYPDFEDKIKPIHGDLTKPELGISSADRQILENEVNIVFHSAATIKFDEPLRVATQLNVVAVRMMINLCKRFKHLEVFVHVSTAYSNCDRPYIEEVVYPPAVEPQKLLDALEWMDDEMVDIVTPKLLGNKPNTYTFTKQLAEQLLVTEGMGLPIVIVRPSIVGAAWKEPLPGWIDNYNGPNGVYIATGKGILRIMKGEQRAVADIVPVDLPVNMLITAAWYTALAKPSQLLTYNCTIGTVNPFTWGEMESVIMNFFKKTPLDSAFRRPNVGITNNNFIHDYWIFFGHLIPAYIADLGYCLIGQKPRMVKVYNRLHKSMEILSYFTSHSWEWTNSNLDMLKNHLSPEDRKIFYFDPRPLHWPTYLETYCLGAKQYLLNEDLAALPQARAHMRKLRNIRYMFNTMVVVILWRVLIARSQIARNVWYLIVGLVFKFVQYFRITSSMHK